MKLISRFVYTNIFKGKEFLDENNFMNTIMVKGAYFTDGQNVRIVTVHGLSELRALSWCSSLSYMALNSVIVRRKKLDIVISISYI